MAHNELDEVRRLAETQYAADLERLGTMNPDEVAFVAQAPSLSPEDEDTEPWLPSDG